MLGGSSSINGMIFQRGNPLDYERWGADPGMETWDYAHCLPYFKRMETCLAGGDDYRGTDGPLVLERGPATTPLFEAFFEAVQQAGYPLTDDVNGYRQEGFARFDRNIDRGRRLARPAPTCTRSLVRPQPGGRVPGAGRPRSCSRAARRRGRVPDASALARGRDTRHARAARSSVRRRHQLARSCCSSRAWVRPRTLRSLGIDVVADLPGVGENLQDHLEVYVQHACTQPVSMAPALKWRNRPWIGFQWLFFRKGPGATNHFEAGGFVRSNDDVAYPNLMFHFLPIAVRYDGTAPAGGHGYQVHVGPMYSDARGSVRITTDDPDVHPALRFNYLSTDQDRREWVEAVRAARKILSQPAFGAVRRRRALPGPGRRDRRGDPGLGGPRRRDGAPPVVHLRAWALDR